jgi:tetratricopeptide (TPR) repeat protein
VASSKPRGGVRAQGVRPDAPAAGPFRLRQTLAAVALLAVGSLLAYANTFHSPFILDDRAYILTNPALGRLWPPWGIIPYRPVLGFTLALNYRISGLEVWSYHAANWLIHLCAGLALFGLARRALLTERLAPRFGAAAHALALAGALIWVLHPLHTQAVTYVIQRSESLMGLFLLLTLYCAARAYDSRHPFAWWVGAAVCFGLGLGTKQTMAAAPLVVFLYYWVFHREAFARRWTRWCAAALGLACVAAAAWVAFISAHSTAGFGMGGVRPWEYAWTQCAVVLHYLQLSFWPSGLCLDYGWPVARHVSEVSAAAAVMLALLALTGWAVLRRHPAGFPGAWFFVILAPTSSVMPIADVAVEHRMYLPLAGPVLLLVTGAYWAWRRLMERRPEWALRWSRAGQAAGWLAAGAAAVALGARTAVRNLDYRTELAIWQDTVNKRPLNPRARSNLGAALTAAGRAAEALEHFEEALRLNSGSAEAHSNYGWALAELGRTDEAIAHYQEAMRLDKNYAEPHCNMGIAMMKQGRLQAAALHLGQALERRANYVTAQFYYGTVLGRLGKLDAAREHLTAAIRLKPDYAEAYLNLGMTLNLMGRREEAAAAYMQALKIRPEHPDAHHNLAGVLLDLGRPQEALQHAAEAVRLRPTYAEARNNLGVALSRSDRAAEARQQYEEAVRRKSDYPDAQYNLGSALLDAGELDRAELHLNEALRLKPDFPQARQALEKLRERREKQ